MQFADCHLAPSRCGPTELFSTKSRMIVAGSWPNDLFDTNKSDGSPHGRAFVTAERDGYFRLQLANRKVHSRIRPVAETDIPLQHSHGLTYWARRFCESAFGLPADSRYSAKICLLGVTAGRWENACALATS